MRHGTFINKKMETAFTNRRDAYNWDYSGVNEDDVIYMRYLMMVSEG